MSPANSANASEEQAQKARLEAIKNQSRKAGGQKGKRVGEAIGQKGGKAAGSAAGGAMGSAVGGATGAVAGVPAAIPTGGASIAGGASQGASRGGQAGARIGGAAGSYAGRKAGGYAGKKAGERAGSASAGLSAKFSAGNNSSLARRAQSKAFGYIGGLVGSSIPILGTAPGALAGRELGKRVNPLFTIVFLLVITLMPFLYFVTIVSVVIVGTCTTVGDSYATYFASFWNSDASMLYEACQTLNSDS